MKQEEYERLGKLPGTKVRYYMGSHLEAEEMKKREKKERNKK